MFARTSPLSFAEHGNLRVLETNDYSYARNEVLSPVLLSEIGDVAREYPIVFPDNGSGMPAALMGLEAGANVYVGADGGWLGTYIPAFVRRYPFIFGQAPDQKESDRFVVLFDIEAPHFRDPSGHVVFNGDGSLSDHMKRRLALLEEIQKKIPITQKMVGHIQSAGLLVERVIRIRKGEQEHRVGGLRIIDEKKLNALPHQDFAELRDKGVLPLVYAHLISWANFRQGPLAGKYPDLAARPETKNPVFLFEEESDDMIDFSRLT